MVKKKSQNFPDDYRKEKKERWMFGQKKYGFTNTLTVEV